jgi:integrase/recombinase XerD
MTDATVPAPGKLTGNLTGRLPESTQAIYGAGGRVGLKVFFTVVAKPPDQVRPADVLAFITAQRTGRTSEHGALQAAGPGDEPAGVSGATVRRRLSIVSGFFAFFQARGDMAANPVPRGLPTPDVHRRDARRIDSD